MATALSQIFHLYNRAGFGITYKAAKALTNKSIKEIVNDLFNTNAIGAYIKAVNKEDIPKVKEMLQNGASKKEINELINEKNVELNLKWVKQLQNTNNLLLEKQTLFWHNHFACRIRNPYLMQELNNIHRRFAFSNFRTLLVEVSKSPAMIEYLNNQQNRKEHPNENFARELMELFTLGRGNYTENDIKESARAFTGWAFSRDNFEFEFREKQHDSGEKIFLGRKGKFGGEDIINIIMDNKQTAYFLCKKIYKYYVNETIDEARVKELGDYYYLNQYNTEILLKKIFLSDWFYKEVNMGCNIKSPVEYLVGLSRQFKITYSNEKVLLNFQRQLGQVLFFPPNVAGWPGGKNWIDSSTLMFRMRLPSLILNDGEIENDDKPSDPEDVMQAKPTEQLNQKLKTSLNWVDILNAHEGLNTENLCRALLAKQPALSVINTISNAAVNDLKEQIVKLLSLPEYNLC